MKERTAAASAPTASPESHFPRPNRSERCSAAVARLVREEGVPLDELYPPEHLELWMLGDGIFVVLKDEDDAVYGPYTDLARACRAVAPILLDTPAGTLFEWRGGPAGAVLTVPTEGDPRVDLHDEWAMEVPETVFSIEGDAARPGGGWMINVSRWGGWYWVQGDGLRRQLPEDRHGTLEAALSAYVGSVSIPSGGEVRTGEFSPAEVAERFTLHPSSEDGQEGVVTVNGEPVVLRVAEGPE